MIRRLNFAQTWPIRLAWKGTEGAQPKRSSIEGKPAATKTQRAFYRSCLLGWSLSNFKIFIPAKSAKSAQILYKFWFSTNAETAMLSKDCRKLDFWGWINIVIMSFQVFTDCPYLIFVTNITNEICGEKSVMRRNSRFLYMTNVEKSAMWRNSEFWNYSTCRKI